MIKVKDEKFVAPLVREVSQAWEEQRQTPHQTLSFANLMAYFKNGNRLAYEEEYFARRKALLVSALYAFEHRTPEAIAELEEVIYLVLQEYSWALHAHWSENLTSESVKTCIDLFSAETGQALAEIAWQLKSELSPVLYDWIGQEIENRLLTPFERQAWDWETKENNWSAVVGGSLGMIVLRQVSDEGRRTALLARLDTSFQSFLRGFGEDGSTPEGTGYWAYGFGYYIYFATLLAEVLGDTSYLDLPKVKAIAEFPFYTEIADGDFLPFSDYDKVAIPSGLLAFLKQRLGAAVPEVKAVSHLDDDTCYRFAAMVFNLRYSEQVKCDKATTFSHYFPDHQWLIVRDVAHDVYFAARGGRNDESHNHIDLGHFVYGSLQTLSLTDLGAGEYTKDYFSDKRYDYFVNNAQSHAIPAINGQSQQEGAYQAEVIAYQKMDDTLTFSLELAKAYPLNPELLSFKRTFHYHLQIGELELTDSFKFTKAENVIAEHFITRLASEAIDEKTLLIGEMTKITSQTAKASTQIIRHEYANHVGKQETAYQIQEEYQSKSTDFDIHYHIKNRGK